MLIAHISLTPLAGSPIRIVNAINTHSSYEARLINLNPAAYGMRTYGEDLDWIKNRDECEDIIARADILHFHHFFDVSSTINPFGFNFTEANSKAKIVRQYHSCPEFAAGKNKSKLEAILKDETPSLIIAQYHERYYPRAKIVPNIVPINDELYMPKDAESIIPQIFFSPSTKTPAFASRWDTKARSEVLRILQSLQKDKIAYFDVAEETPHDECLRRRQSSDIIIDDVVTGSYHLSSLEGLSQGKAVVCHIDNRLAGIVSELTGAAYLPFVNVDINALKPTLKELCHDKEMLAQIGANSRKWMEKYYADNLMVRHYLTAYDELLEKGGFSKNRLSIKDKAKVFSAIKLPDMLWEKRKKIYFATNPNAFIMYLFDKAKIYIDKLIVKLSNKLKRIFAKSGQ